MSRDLYPYYERELGAIRQLAGEFAKLYPKAAGRLGVDARTDPHVERLIESFALLAGRVHHKLDDEFPELTDALFHVLYPHYLAPVPSAAVVEFVADPALTPPQKGFHIPRGSKLFTPPVKDVPCRYRTAYPVTLWPVVVEKAQLRGPPYEKGVAPPPGTAAVLRVSLAGRAGATFDKMALDTLRFHLFGENPLVADLYEALLNHAAGVALVAPDRPDAKPIDLGPGALTPVGFGPDEGLYPFPRQSFPGYRLLTEFFAYPAKFWFVDVYGFARARAAGFGAKLDLLVYLRRAGRNLEDGVEAGTFRLGCAPAVNLFEQTAEPLPLTQARTEYRVAPDVAHPLGLEVYSVDRVVGKVGGTGEEVEFRPFYAIDHGSGRGDRGGAFWYPTRRASTRENDPGTEVYLSVVDAGWAPTAPAVSTLVVWTTCTNRNLPADIRFAGDGLEFQLAATAPVQRIRCVRPPTAPLRQAGGKGGYWRLVSHLSLNHLSLADGGDGLLALRELLRLYERSDPKVDQQQAHANRLMIDGLVRVAGKRVVGRVADDPAADGFCTGVEVTVELDEEKYAGTGAFLFAAVLDRFFGAYATINSFTRLVARTMHGDGLIRRWPPRAGDRTLV